MQGALGLVVVLGLFLTAYYFLLGAKRGVGLVPVSVGGSLDGFGGSVLAFLEGLVAVFGVCALAANGAESTGSFAAGAVVGVASAVGLVVRKWWPGRLGYEFLFSVLGLVAAVPAIAELFGNGQCEVGVGQGVRIAAVLVLTGVWAACLVAVVVFKLAKPGSFSAVGLAFFGVVDLILFMSGPIGDSLVSPTGAVCIALGTAIIGGLSGYVPHIVVPTCGVFLGFVAFLSATYPVVPGCEKLQSAPAMSVLAGFCLAYWIGASLISKFRLGRTRRGIFS